MLLIYVNFGLNLLALKRPVIFPKRMINYFDALVFKVIHFDAFVIDLCLNHSE